MTKNETNPGGLPYGHGSLQKRGLMWWAIYRNIDGVKVQVSSKTADLDEARRFLAGRALEVARARVAALEALGETGSADSRKQPTRGNRRPGAGKQSVSHNSSRRGGRTNQAGDSR